MAIHEKEIEPGSHPGLSWGAQEARPSKPDYCGRGWFQIFKGKEGLEIKVAPVVLPREPQSSQLNLACILKTPGELLKTYQRRSHPDLIKPETPEVRGQKLICLSVCGLRFEVRTPARCWGGMGTCLGWEREVSNTSRDVSGGQSAFSSLELHLQYNYYRPCAFNFGRFPPPSVYPKHPLCLRLL